MEYIISLHTSIRIVVASECQICMYNADSTLPIQTDLVPKCLASAEPVFFNNFQNKQKSKMSSQDIFMFKSMILNICEFLYIAPRFNTHPSTSRLDRKYMYTQIPRHQI